METACFQRLKLKRDKPLSSYTLDLNSRHYTVGIDCAILLAMGGFLMICYVVLLQARGSLK